MKRRLRLQSFTIEIPKPGLDPWILLVIQRVTEDKDGNILQLEDRWGLIHKKVSEVSNEVAHMPYGLFSNDWISVGEIGQAITVKAVEWMTLHYNAEVDDQGRVWVEDGIS